MSELSKELFHFIVELQGRTSREALPGPILGLPRPRNKAQLQHRAAPVTCTSA
jgi:hypothetical protein